MRSHVCVFPSTQALPLTLIRALNVKGLKALSCISHNLLFYNLAFWDLTFFALFLSQAPRDGKKAGGPQLIHKKLIPSV